MASREAVLDALRMQNGRFTDGRVAASFKGWSRVMQYVFIDIGLSLTVKVVDGVPAEPAEGTDETAPIRYEMSSDTLLILGRKEISGMKAYTQKLVKVKASMPDLLKLQKLDAI